MKKKISCSDCSNHFRAEGFRMGFATLFVGKCPACDKTYTCISGTPGQVMAQSLVLADTYMNCAFESAEVLGIPDPCLLNPEQLIAYAQA